MNSLVAAELLKLRTTRLAPILISVAVGLALLSVILTLIFGEGSGLTLATEDAQRSLLGAAGSGGTIMLILGVVAMSGEYRQGTLTPTLLAEPKRWRVILSKVLALAPTGLFVAAVVSVVTIVVALLGLAIKGTDFVMGTSDVFRLVWGVMLSGAMFGALGVGVGALIPNQVGAIVTVLVGQIIVEPLLMALVSDVGRFLPSQAAATIAGMTPDQFFGADPLPLWPAIVALLLWTAALSGAGVFVTERKDIT